ncbi:MAG: acetyltransferase [Crocinitomicaceae bacterium]|jgi:sugar O-acyltransferase (sialic acid O-acetyltransferase NeuD family)|nr:acetyltransferase [Crocinitomicaceae bacterium]MBT6029811.1 acetyltransferase [Crocinitomicaceae bacterium]MBT6513481.1 acetyltransferase [Crocinitomicaceae bacterium]
MDKNKIVLFGTGAFAEVAYWYFTEDSDYEIVAFTADADYCKTETVLDLPLVPFEDLEKSFPSSEYGMHVVIGYNKLNTLRFNGYTKAKAKGYTLVNYIHSSVKIWQNNKFGDNVFIFEDNTIQPYVEFCSNIILWSGNHIGHHSKIGSHTFITSHVVVSGFVEIGEFCFFGVNSTLRDSIQIADKSIVGAGALILENTAKESLYIGSKTQPVAKKSTSVKRI